MANESIIVLVEHDLKDLIPLFLAQRKSDQAAIADALTRRDFECLRKTGHGMTGAGASYGFDHLSVLGERLEQAARAADSAAIDRLRLEIDDYMARVIVKYV